MTRPDMLKIMAIIQTNYANFYRNQSKDQISAAVDLWAEMFSDDEPNLVATAVMKYIAQSKTDYPPVIGQIKDICYRLTHDVLTDWMAWNKVIAALRDIEAHRGEGRHEEYKHTVYNSLPRLVQMTIGSFEQFMALAELSQNKLQDAASDFKWNYREAAEIYRQYEVLPKSIRSKVHLPIYEMQVLEGGKKA